MTGVVVAGVVITVCDVVVHGAVVDVTSRPVLVPDLHQCPADNWPVFAGTVQSTPARAFFVFPLLVGRSRVGTLSLYRNTPGPLGPAGVDTACALVGAVAAELASRLLAPPTPTELTERASCAESADLTDRSPIWRATGVTMAQLNVSAAAAFARLQAHAFGTGTTMADVSQQVIAHLLRLPA